MFERGFCGFMALGAIFAGCGGASSPPQAAGASSPSAASVPIGKPPPRAKDDESDAWGPGGQRGSATMKPTVECPAGARWSGGVCVVTEVVCPAGSRRVQNACIGDVTCPTGVWDGDACRPAPAAAAASTSGGTLPGSIAVPGGGGCFLNINSIPASQVFVDGVALGWTPRTRAPASVGSHTVLFVTDQAKKTVTTSCAAGETKAVLTKFVQADPGY